MDTAWLAGLLEGEGCFILAQKRYPQIALKMTDEDVVTRAAELAPGSTPVRRHARTGNDVRHKAVYCVEWNGRTATNLMWRVLPFMGVRRSERILTVITDWLEISFRLCGQCGNEFRSEVSGRSTYCSDRCRKDRNNATYKPRQSHQCVECGTGITVDPERRSGGFRYCGPTCRKQRNLRTAREKRSVSKI